MKNEFNVLSDTTVSKLLDIYQCRDWGDISWNEFIDLFLEDFEQTVEYWKN
jgi:hypothetical protein